MQKSRSPAEYIDMDRRLESRFESNLEVSVTDLARPGRCVAGLLHDISNSGVCVLTPIPLEAGDPVRLEIRDASFFGIVTYSRAEESSWRSGVAVQRVLLGGSDLSRLLEALLADVMPSVAIGGPEAFRGS